MVIFVKKRPRICVWYVGTHRVRPKFGIACETPRHDKDIRV